MALKTSAATPTSATATAPCSAAARKDEDEAAFQRPVAGHHVGGDHRLAVARPGGVEDAIGEAEADEAPDRRRVAVQRVHLAGDQPGQLRLHLDQPAGQAAGRAAAAFAAADRERPLRELGERRRRRQRQTGAQGERRAAQSEARRFMGRR